MKRLKHIILVGLISASSLLNPVVSQEFSGREDFHVLLDSNRNHNTEGNFDWLDRKGALTEVQYKVLPWSNSKLMGKATLNMPAPTILNTPKKTYAKSELYVQLDLKNVYDLGIYPFNFSVDVVIKGHFQSGGVRS
ncbi:MAG: hypothetical protein JKY54_04045, partial [Flavobacteriales bacterium]|nr:hypothetical protein [Flavobacteriales bacterium]